MSLQGKDEGEKFKVMIKASDMADDMQSQIIELAQTAIQKYSVEKDIAGFLKKELDRNYGATWHAVVGKNFGSYVTHESNYFLYFYVGPLAFLLFKTG
ncbi:uncharacterized protein SAPINGB_P003736 [Magnusiomyces paraingens]|uniref:Dynein light chain n=1 Tax=Magnusiomyces paraingens TaxID=2606893 RepID=A0A5E8BRR2_9ASCO|nr:uncharacterized protein SAPINGB_P003736 [Saprochaete ingens]VVT53761.1 unnamed protein product [Saprochaete ingens]